MCSVKNQLKVYATWLFPVHTWIRWAVRTPALAANLISLVPITALLSFGLIFFPRHTGSLIGALVWNLIAGLFCGTASFADEIAETCMEG